MTTTIDEQLHASTLKRLFMRTRVVLQSLSINPKPYTLHPNSYTLHPTPYTLHAYSGVFMAMPRCSKCSL